MDPETRAESLEDYMSGILDQERQPQKFPTVAELDAQIETRAYRRGAGNIFIAGMGHVRRLPPMPPRNKSAANRTLAVLERP